MSAIAELKNRSLDGSELEIVSATWRPTIEQQSVEQLKALILRLRKAHVRAKDISARQQREIRRKSDPRGAKRAQDNAGSIAKVQTLSEAIKRVDEELARANTLSLPNP